tara:strand:+ start:6379 stop:7023 length:645 start_codon:yes stop_codon:yes gene_type:complete
MAKIYANGVKEIDVAAGSSIAIFTQGTADVYYYTASGSKVGYWYLSSSVSNEEVSLDPDVSDSGVLKVRVEAGVEEVVYEVGTAPEITLKSPSLEMESAILGDAVVSYSVVRNTIAGSATVTVAQHRDQMLYQDASGGAVTMTSATASLLAAEFADLPIGKGILQTMSSNHASNTSTISGGTGVTLVGSGAVTNTGGSFMLIKTAASTFDLVRI